MDKWNEIRTAYKLAQHQTLSATAQEMGVHRSTVMRHIDTLEAELGVLLFQRNDKGYLPTEAGLEIMRLGEVTENHFSQLGAQIKSKEQALSGTLTVTAINDMASMLMPVIQQYQRCYPNMRVDFIGDLRKFNLEYGEAILRFVVAINLRHQTISCSQSPVWRWCCARTKAISSSMDYRKTITGSSIVLSP